MVPRISGWTWIQFRLRARNTELVPLMSNKKGKQGLGVNKRTAEYTGGASAIGAIIGAIAGGGKRAAIRSGSRRRSWRIDSDRD